jgi:hypothetical protein
VGGVGLYEVLASGRKLSWMQELERLLKAIVVEDDGERDEANGFESSSWSSRIGDDCRASSGQSLCLSNNIPPVFRLG